MDKAGGTDEAGVLLTIGGCAAAEGWQLNRWWSERCERTFAHVCENGRRTPELGVRGQTNVSKLAYALNVRPIIWDCCSAKFWVCLQAALCENGDGDGFFCGFSPLGHAHSPLSLPKHQFIRQPVVESI